MCKVVEDNKNYYQKGQQFFILLPPSLVKSFQAILCNAVFSV